MADEQLEFGFLKRAVEIKFDRRLSTTSDFTALSEEMEERISPSTLKRLWGYVGMVVTPRRSTLDALSQFVGYKDYRAFCSSLRESSFSSSSYFNAERLDADTLQPGDRFQIGWRPDRIVSLEYQGGNRFIVLNSVRSKLQEGDILVTRFTDTGWTPKFAILSGIVTEYGGILCHAAIVSREYGIPAIVCCKDAMSKISDGQTITIDGSTGVVTINGGS